MKKCFFVTPIGQDDSPERKNSDTVLNHIIKPVCEKAGFEVIRVDQLHTVDRIDHTITEYLSESELVIIDLSYHNANVFYEFGYRQALGLPLIPLITEGESIPFDVNTLRTIYYVTNDLDKVESVKSKLFETINHMTFETPQKPTVNETNIDNTLLLNIIDRLEDLESAVQIRNDKETERIAELMSKYSHPQKSAEAEVLSSLIGPIFQMAAQDPQSFKNLSDAFGNADS
ncbi:hypothetical protein FSZ06_06170 [Enterococcus gallinarum]|uniref:hypothetical protein n=1 Tax=Enterococcus TaxID=1350 RepID=UPI0011CAC96F|nr:hypothetical protein [Enterococcus gallinarum]MBU5357266.1 hypothetical protein [Enterococcus gallinarum]TXJ87570.1 hypothetical protein FSZ06_06170 [Enterococcus gallinarum]